MPGRCGAGTLRSTHAAEGSGAMPKVEMDLETPVAPERVRAALLDFSDRRPELWPGIEPSLYHVYSVGATTAEVKEGSRMPGMSVWAVEHYDWSDPRLVTWTVRESNFCTPGSYVSAAITGADRPKGTTQENLHALSAERARAGNIAATQPRGGAEGDEAGAGAGGQGVRWATAGGCACVDSLFALLPGAFTPPPKVQS